MRKIIFLITFVFLIAFNFASSDYSLDKAYCVDLGNTDAQCTNYINNATTISNILDLEYSKNQDLDSFMACIDKQKEKLNFDYREVRSICYNPVQKTTTFKAKCFYDLKNSYLNVRCKGVFPSDNYIWDISLDYDVNGLTINPKLILDPDFTITGTKLALYDTTIDLDEKNIPITNHIIMSPLSVEVKDPSLSLENLFVSNDLPSASLDSISRAYLDCIAIKTILSEKKYDKYILKKSGYSFLLGPNQIQESCKDNVAYAFAMDLSKYEAKKAMFFDILDVLIDNYLNDSNFSVDAMQTHFDALFEEHQKFSYFEQENIKNSDASLKLALDTDRFLGYLQNATKDLDAEEKKQVFASVGTTLLKNNEDALSIRRKNKLSLILDFFDIEISKINDDSLKQIYSDVQLALIRSYFDSSDIVDFSGVEGKISPHSIALEKFNLDFSKPLYINNEDLNRDYTLIPDQDLIVIDFKDYKVYSNLPLTISENSIILGQKKLALLDFNQLKQFDNEIISSIDLTLDGEFPIYSVKTELFGHLLGIIKIKELIVRNYFATTGILSDVDKPWWDFLVFYN